MLQPRLGLIDYLKKDVLFCDLLFFGVDSKQKVYVMCCLLVRRASWNVIPKLSLVEREVLLFRKIHTTTDMKDILNLFIYKTDLVN